MKTLVCRKCNSLNILLIAKGKYFCVKCGAKYSEFSIKNFFQLILGCFVFSLLIIFLASFFKSANASYIQTFWGDIQGTLSDQTDLQSALDGKASTSHTQTASTITDFDTEVSNNTDVSANTTHRSSDGSNHTFIDQSVISGAIPTFTNTNFSISTDKNYLTDAEKVVIGNTSGTNTGDQSFENIDHDSLLNTHNLTTDIDHDSLTNFVSDEHIDWSDGGTVTSENFSTYGRTDIGPATDSFATLQRFWRGSIIGQVDNNGSNLRFKAFGNDGSGNAINAIQFANYENIGFEFNEDDELEFLTGNEVFGTNFKDALADLYGYGEMYQNDNVIVTTVTTQDVWYEIGNYGVGELQNVTFSSDSLVIGSDHSGIYQLDVTLSGTGSIANQSFEFSVSVNDSIITKTKQSHKFTTTTNTEEVSLTGLLDLSGSDYVKIELRNTSGTGNFTVENSNLTIHHID